MSSRWPVPDGPITPAGVQALEEAFGREHERTYGHRAGADEPVELVSVQLIARAADAEPPRLPDAERLLGQEAPAPLGVRPAYFGPELGWFDTPCCAGVPGRTPDGAVHHRGVRRDLSRAAGARAVLDRFGNIISSCGPAKGYGPLRGGRQGNSGCKKACVMRRALRGREKLDWL